MPTINYIDPIGVMTSLPFNFPVSPFVLSPPTGRMVGALVKAPDWSKSMIYVKGAMGYDFPMKHLSFPLSPMGRLILSTFPPIYTERNINTQTFARIFPPVYVGK